MELQTANGPELTPREEKKFAELLKSRFPWLGTDEPAESGADEVGKLAELYHELTKEGQR